MRAKTTDLFQDALKYALKGDEEYAREYLNAYEERIMAVARKIEALKRESEQLDREHTAICVIFGANRK